MRRDEKTGAVDIIPDNMEGIWEGNDQDFVFKVYWAEDTLTSKVCILKEAKEMLGIEVEP